MRTFNFICLTRRAAERASARVNVSVCYQFVDTAKRPWPTSRPAAGITSIGQRVARSLPERWPADLPRDMGCHCGSRPSTRGQGGAAWSLPLSNRERKWTPRRATFFYSPPCHSSAQASPGVGVTLFWVRSFLRLGGVAALGIAERHWRADMDQLILKRASASICLSMLDPQPRPTWANGLHGAYRRTTTKEIWTNTSVGCIASSVSCVDLSVVFWEAANFEAAPGSQGRKYSRRYSGGGMSQAGYRRGLVESTLYRCRALVGRIGKNSARRSPSTSLMRGRLQTFTPPLSALPGCSKQKTTKD
jgi:hypothetical protein